MNPWLEDQLEREAIQWESQQPPGNLDPQGRRYPGQEPNRNP